MTPHFVDCELSIPSRVVGCFAGWLLFVYSFPTCRAIYWVQPKLKGHSARDTIFIKPTGEYPCQWDDLIDVTKRVIATIYTEQEARKDHLPLGIKKGKDGVYDIVTMATEINYEVVRNALTKLSKKTGRPYQLKVDPTAEDRIISFANRLMQPLGKYGNSKRGYDFSQVSSPKHNAEVIGIWIGEILYEALVYKDVKTVQSLTRMIQIEIADLIKQSNHFRSQVDKGLRELDQGKGIPHRAAKKKYKGG